MSVVGSLVYYQAFRQTNAERCSLFFSFYKSVTSNYHRAKSYWSVSGVSPGYLSSWLGPSKSSESAPQSPSLAAMQDRHLVAGDAPSSSQGSSARDAGPRIFVGKLVRGTTESDVRDYFSKFG